MVSLPRCGLVKGFKVNGASWAAIVFWGYYHAALPHSGGVQGHPLDDTQAAVPVQALLDW